MPASATLDPLEIDKFSRIAAQWWDETGPFAPLHRLNPLRLSYIREQIVAHYRREENNLRPFAGLTLLDAGCGGGLVCEPMARLGAAVTGLDADGEAIEIAKTHAADSGLCIEYITGTTDMLAGEDQKFDIVLALEIVEHVADVAAFVASLRAVLKPGGLLILSTLNRTPQSFLAAIVGAEYVLRWLPRGTHDWRRFLRPSELARAVRRAGMAVRDVTGMTYDPLSGRFSLGENVAVNYFMCAF